MVCSILIMGNYRSEPEITKLTHHEMGTKMEVVATGMCGWRLYMEDGHVAQLDLGNGNSLFAVFDGHGGTFVLTQDPK